MSTTIECSEPVKGCLSGLFKENKHEKKIIGMKFGKLYVLGGDRKEVKYHFYNCICDCGTIISVRKDALMTGNSKTCGCSFSSDINRKLRKELATTHGMRYTPTYKSWIAMKTRCTNPNHENYSNYGGRGITVCPEWLKSFEAFYADMGDRPKGHTIDRIDNELGYFKENCKWSTAKEQANNKRNNRK